MKFVKWIFRTAGVFGLLTMIPIIFAEKLIEQIMPPAVNHPEFFYGFVLLNICWQMLYLILSKDPLRYRMMILPAFLAKASAPLAIVWLVLQDRIPSQWMQTAIMDGAFALLFLVAFWITGRETRTENAKGFQYG